MDNLATSRREHRVFYGWYIVAGSVIANMATAGIYWQGFQVFFLPMLEEYGWSRAALSGAFSMRQVETGVAAPLVGVLVDRLGPRKVIVGSALILGFGIVLTSFTFSLWSFYLFFFLASLGASGCSHGVSWAVAISRWFDRKRGTALGLGMSGPIFSGAALLALGWGVQEFGWRPTVFVAGLGLLLIVVPAALLVRDRPEDMGLLPDGASPEGRELEQRQQREAAGTGRGDRRQRHAGVAEEDSFSVREALRTRAFWTVLLMFSALFFGVAGFQVHQVAYFQDDVGLSAIQATSVLGILFLVSGLGRVGVGVLADLYSLRTVLTLLILSNAAAWLYLILVPINTFWQSVPFAVLFGIPFGAMVSVRPMMLVKLFGGRSLGSLVGLFQAGALGSGVVGPLLMGWIFDVRGEYFLSLVVFVAVSLAALPLALTMKPAAPPQRAPDDAR